MSEYVWVVGFFHGTDNFSKFIRTPKNNARFYIELYEGEHLDVRVLTSEEFAEFAEGEQKKLDKKNNLI